MTEQLLESDNYLDSNHMSYDRLYKKFKGPSIRSCEYYKIQFSDEKPYFVYRQTYNEREITKYDSLGHISSEISFILIQNKDEIRSIPEDSFEEIIEQKPKLTLSPNHLPTNIWFINRLEEEIELKW